MEQANPNHTVGEPCPLPAVTTLDPDILDQIPAQMSPWADEVDRVEPNIVRGVD